MNELVSIVLPTYNRADLLGRSIQSCLEQTYRNLEVIVVDDGSTDGTPKLVREYAAKDARVRSHRQQNAGLPCALNAGFLMAKGELLSWTSDDNRYHPEAIATLARELDAHADAGMVYSDFNVISTSGAVKEVVRDRAPEQLPAMNVVGPCFLYRRSVAQRVGDYLPQRRLVEDWDYWLRLSLVAPIVRCPEVLYDFLDHPSNLSNGRQREVIEATLGMRENTPHSEARSVKYRQPLARKLATLYWAEGQKMSGVRYRLKSFGI